jgi:hypothetical protein
MAQTITFMATLSKDVIKKFLLSVCGFMADAAKEITKNQGYDDLDKLYQLDDKGVDTLCSIVRKPHTSASGSTSGHAISNLAQDHLKLAIFAMKNFKHVSHKIDLDSLTKEDIIAFSQQRQMELTFMYKTKGFAHATFKDLAKTFKTVMEQLEHAFGVSGDQLAYVPCKKLIPLDEDDNPPTNYPSLDDKAIARAPILGDHGAFAGQSAKSHHTPGREWTLLRNLPHQYGDSMEHLVRNVWADARMASCHLDQEREEWPQVVSSPVCP